MLRVGGFFGGLSPWRKISSRPSSRCSTQSPWRTWNLLAELSMPLSEEIKHGRGSSWRSSFTLLNIPPECKSSSVWRNSAIWVSCTWNTSEYVSASSLVWRVSIASAVFAQTRNSSSPDATPHKSKERCSISCFNVRLMSMMKIFQCDTMSSDLVNRCDRKNLQPLLRQVLPVVQFDVLS